MKDGSVLVGQNKSMILSLKVLTPDGGIVELSWSEKGADAAAKRLDKAMDL